MGNQRYLVIGGKMSLKKEVKPFFAKFLEAIDPEELSRLRGAATLKYPSDDDEPVTHKYPSDDDEHVTHKYPSDNDDAIPSVD